MDKLLTIQSLFKSELLWLLEVEDASLLWVYLDLLDVVENEFFFFM